MSRTIRTLAPVNLSRSRAAWSGALAAAFALGISELAAGAAGLPSLVVAVGDWVIDSVPASVKEWAISTFGTNDKVVLVSGIVVVTIGLGAVFGAMAAKRFWVGVVGFAAFAALAGLAAASNPAASDNSAFLAASLAGLAGIGALFFLFGLARQEVEVEAGRRRFLLGAGSVAVLAMVAAGWGRALLQRSLQIVAGREDVVLPNPLQPVAEPTPAQSMSVEGLTPIVVPNADFYRIDTALVVPRVDIPNWTLAVTGMVDTPLRITFEDLLAMEMVERYITLSCVSNEVGGDLVGNARWLGTSLPALLDRAGVQAGASQIVGRSVDGFTVGFPVEAAFDGREALVAVGMNGEPLPYEHGFPARLVVSGLYGYVSATKWLAEIELTTWDAFDAYWVPRGWAKEAPIKTQSRIDVPRRGSNITPGERAIAGVAWAPGRGISKVEVAVDDGAWLEAGLSEPLSEDAWRQWSLPYEFARGEHILQVRATDGTGELQEENPTPPAPDGATGWHTVVVTVS
jgi:DMSO/TMAO reductase YedYZ molybdopterin-dependent catalytic subunit